MVRDEIINEYFGWMYKLVCHNKRNSFKKLLSFLHNQKFRYSIPLDANRAEDGIDLRYRFGNICGHPDNIIADALDNEDCSVLEMMVALSNRCEESIMDNPDIGDRTGEWFWNMVKSMGLAHMTDAEFDRDEATYILDRFLDRNYEPNGSGGLFTLENPRRDMRDAEIWYQMMWYLDEVLDN